MLLTATELIEQSWQLYRTHWKRLLPFMLFLFPLYIVLNNVKLFRETLFAYTSLSMIAIMLVLVVLAGILIVLALWNSVAMTLTFQHITAHTPVTPWRASWALAQPLLFPTVYTAIIYTALVFFGSFAFIIPGIIFLVWYAFSFYAVILDHETGLGPFRLSRRLTKGRTFEMLWRIFAPGLFFALILVLIKFVILSPFVLFSSTINIANVTSDALSLNTLSFVEVLKNIITNIINAIMAPLSAFSGFLLYLSAKASYKASDEARTLPM